VAVLDEAPPGHSVNTNAGGDVLVSLVDAREAAHVPAGAPDPIAVIVFMISGRGVGNRM